MRTFKKYQHILLISYRLMNKCIDNRLFILHKLIVVQVLHNYSSRTNVVIVN